MSSYAMAVRRHARSRRIVVIGLALLLVAGFALRVLGGDFTISFADFFRILTGTNIPGASFILMESKLPRAVLAVLAGAALGGSGALLQYTLRNPLASPDIVGVSMGASVGAVIAMLAFGWRGLPVSIAALVGSGAIVLVLFWAGNSGAERSAGLAGVDALSTTRLVLCGLGISMAGTAMIYALISRANIYQAHDAMTWLTGSVTGASWPGIVFLAFVVGIGLPIGIALHHRMQVFALGNDLSVALGAPIARWQRLAIVLVVFLVAATCAVTGPLSFVALLAGPIARALHRGRSAMGTAALIGAVIVVFGDFIAAYAIPDVNLPVGVITGMVGAPFLLRLVLRSTKTSQS